MRTCDDERYHLAHSGSGPETHQSADAVLCAKNTYSTRLPMASSMTRMPLSSSPSSCRLVSVQTSSGMTLILLCLGEQQQQGKCQQPEWRGHIEARGASHVS